jgi:transcriptional regulator with XRE-family HTH domain
MGRRNTSGPGPNIDLGLRVREAFRIGGYGKLNLEKMGAKIGMTAAGMGKLLNGHNAATYDTLRQIAIVNNVNFEWLATGRGEARYSLTGGKRIDITRIPPEKLPGVLKLIDDVIELNKSDYKVEE